MGRVAGLFSGQFSLLYLLQSLGHKFYICDENLGKTRESDENMYKLGHFVICTFLKAILVAKMHSFFKICIDSSKYDRDPFKFFQEKLREIL